VADTARARILAQLAEICKYEDQEKAIRYGEEAVVLSKRTGKDEYEADAYNALGLIYTDRSEYKKAEELFNRSLKIYEKRNDKYSMSLVYSNIGVVYDYQGDLVNTLLYYNKSLKLSEEIKDTLGIAYVLYNIGNVHKIKGDLGQAMSNWITAGKIFEKMNMKEGTASVYLNLGLIYKKQGNIRKGLEYYMMALKIAEEIEDQVLIGDVCNNIGVLYMEDEKDNEKALFYMNRCLEIGKKLGDNSMEASSYLNIGQVQMNEKKYKEAIESYQRSIGLFREIGNNGTLSIALYHLGHCYNLAGNYPKAIEACMEALEKAKSQGMKEEISEIYEVLSEVYFKSNDAQKAFEYHKLYADAKDSVMLEKNNKQMLELQSQYDSDKKEKEIAILQQQNDIQTLELKRKRIVIYSVIGALFLLLIMSVVIYNRYQIKQKANVLLALRNAEIQDQKNIIEEKNKDITDSIVYAKRIQEAMLPAFSVMQNAFPEIFVLFKPKDIVSGDFYFFDTLPNGSSVIAAVDCTGHGVPGAFMSIVGHNSLNQSIHESGKYAPAEILDSLNKLVTHALQQNKTSGVKDGMDISLCAIDLKNMLLQYAGAMNSMYHIRNNKLNEIKANKLYIGAQAEQQNFTNHELPLKSGDVIYLYTDGFADQFGGPKGKKFKYKPLQELLLSIHEKPMSSQHAILNNTVEEWKGNLEQVDDILIIGIRV
jgi:serine phosphatase RsbU (regulator of sigma subunit)/Tfp pilus assembly protein PilF